MSIWFKEYTLEELIPLNNVNMLAHIGLELTEIGPDFLAGRIPVDTRTTQPFGIVHGGASVVLAESLGSIAANLVLDNAKNYAVGLEVNANHLRSVRSGWVTGIAKAAHIGRTTQVWEIKMHDDEGKPSAISRLTMAVLQR